MRRLLGSIGVGVSAFIFIGLALPACSGTSTSTPESGGSGGSDAGSSVDLEGGTPPTLSPDDACFATKAAATPKERAIDIVAAIDDSTSMGTKWAAIKEHLGDTFTALLESNQIDYRVIGVGQNMSLGALVDEKYKDKYFQYTQEVQSHNLLCMLLEGYDKPPFGVAGAEPEGGWSEWLRPDTFKVFLVFTDENPSCGNFNDHDSPFQGEVTAVAFDQALREKSATHFGDQERRNYVWHSIVGVGGPSQATGAAYPPSEPLISELCVDDEGGPSYNVGYGYQALSRLTGGLRYPVCSVSSYDAVLDHIATKVIDVASVECEFPIPEAPPDKDVNPDSVVVVYTSGETGEKKVLYQVGGKGACKDDRFYIAGGEIRLCPASCNEVQADDSPTLETLYGCNVTVH